MIPGGIGIIVAIGKIANIIILHHHHRHRITMANIIPRHHLTIVLGGMMALPGGMMTSFIIPNQTRVGNRFFDFIETPLLSQTGEA